jgi:hypothetical protein
MHVAQKCPAVLEGRHAQEQRPEIRRMQQAAHDVF